MTVSLTNSRPDFSGVWKMNCEKSVLRGTVPKDVLIRIGHREPALVQQVLLTSASGVEQLQTFVYEAGVEVSNSIGGVPARTLARWDGTELVIESWMKTLDRELYFKDHWTLEGATLTMAHRDDDLEGQISVLEKASQADIARFGKYKNV
jgi:hypothetical protein